MSSRNRTPSALEPYLRLPPEASLILLTGTLGCSAHWLTARFAGSLLNAENTLGVEGSHGKETGVILVSWMRDLAVWKNEIRRTTVVDVAKLAKEGRFGFVDCFTTLSDLKEEDIMAELEKMITAAITQIVQQKRDVVLVLDNPDALLALNLCTAQQLNTLILGLRSSVHSTVLSVSADLPLLAAATSDMDRIPSPLEIECAAFVVQQAHMSRFVMSVRELDTGAAKDISGVLRVTRGGAAYDEDEEDSDEVKEMEALYLVQKDGNAKVFERGSSSI
ncbi:hypothetical protein LTR56_011974 [Elasticomyces elasticus]|nr:hypothetical protein LTR22_018073 [Elasticomyces elasticus]KAK3640178.1 hypothetical protein LTR56_011974 [Elasticomyces elasticus]KAK4913305.1 hypothetical protein LTR49_018378 [Elasticomyces elasticus]KAK5749027.1 hypothetical protein LTS12_020925 [Elasticomyces elasticus]